MLARGAERRREIAVRLALGAGRGRIVRELLVESLVLALAGGALGLLFAYWGIDLLLAIAPESITHLAHVGLDPRVLIFAVLASMIVGVIFAPIVEEIFFRGFLFQGFRQRYGWIGGLLISAVIFAAAHFDLVAFLPTFLLGALLAYIYPRSNSVWPGIILHILNNGFALCAALAATRLSEFIPS